MLKTKPFATISVTDIAMQARVMLGLRVVQTGQEFDPNGPRELKVLKTNLGAYQKPLGFIFAPLYPAGVMLKWQKDAPKTYREPTQRDECGEWLEDYLKTNPEGLSPKEVVAAGRDEGFSRPMVYRARKELSAHIQNTEGRQAPGGNRWKWSETLSDSTEDEAE